MQVTWEMYDLGQMTSRNGWTGKKGLDLLSKALMIRFSFQKDYLPSLWKVALNKKNGSGEAKFEVTTIIQATKK